VATGNAGDTSQDYKDQILLRVNIFRRMAGAQPVTFDAEKGRKAQLAAMMMSANNDITHHPPSTWKYWSQDAADAALASALTIGIHGPSAILGFIQDYGEKNLPVGHRAAILWPPYRIMATGNVPNGVEFRGAGVLWVNDAARVIQKDPLFDDIFVGWPPRGYVPHYLLTGRWNVDSIERATLSTDINMKDVSVEVLKNGIPCSVRRWTDGGGVTWTLDGTEEGDTGFDFQEVNGEWFSGPENVATDIKYSVKISNIKSLATNALYTGSGINNGQYSYEVVAFNPDLAVVDPAQASNLINISTRSVAGSGSSTLIAGMIVRGTGPRKILIRGGGPWLRQFSVNNTLDDPVLTLYEGQTPVSSNDNWGESETEITSAAIRAGASPFAAGSKDAAMVVSIKPDVQYTVHLTGKLGGAGSAIVEAYDVDQGADSRLVNISTRSYVGTGQDVQIAGFVVRGVGPRRVLIRGAGPWLKQFGVTGILENPFLKLFRGQTLIAENDDWEATRTEVIAATQAVGASQFTAGSKDAALVFTVDPNVPYTAHVSGVGDSAGSALVEVYEIP
jgi:hypothetical protein